MPIPASALIDSLHNDANVTPFRVDDHAAPQIKPDMRFIVDIRRAVSEQEIAYDQFIARNYVAQRPKPITVLSIVPNASLMHEPGKKARAVMCHEIGESCFILTFAKGDRACELDVHYLDLGVRKID